MENQYSEQDNTNMTIYEAIEAMKQGRNVRRVSWVDKNAYWWRGLLFGGIYNHLGSVVFRSVDDMLANLHNNHGDDWVVVDGVPDTSRSRDITSLMGNNL